MKHTADLATTDPNESERAAQSLPTKAASDRWKTDNTEAIAAYNAWIEQNGLPLERYRAF